MYKQAKSIFLQWCMWKIWPHLSQVPQPKVTTKDPVKSIKATTKVSSVQFRGGGYNWKNYETKACGVELWQ